MPTPCIHTMQFLRKPWIYIPLVYLCIGALWIFYTDAIVHSLFSDPGLILRFQNYKGWLFVFLSSSVIFILISLHERRQNIERAKREQVFHKTVKGSCHIILNYINQTKLLHLEAEKHPDFDMDVLQEAEALGDEALGLLLELDNLSIIETDAIDAVIYKDLRSEPHTRASKNQAEE